MQVFVPSNNFSECVRVLDYRRLGKQRVECKQILSALDGLRLMAEINPSNLHDAVATPRAWARHPATLQWKGYESALGVYMSMCVGEWANRGYVNNMVAPYNRETFMRTEGSGFAHMMCEDARDAELPPWWGDERVHSSHRNALLFKDPEHYRQFHWDAIPVLNYYWPTKSDPDWTPDGVTPSKHFRGIDKI